MNETADAVIVGGGVIGASTAYHLAKRQFGRVVLLEKDTLAGGSTGRSVATIDSFTLQESLVKLYTYSTNFFHNCREILGGECGFVKTGVIFFGGKKDELPFQSAVQYFKNSNLGIQVTSLEELKKSDPQIDLSGLTTALYASKAGYADPHLTTNRLATAARNLGAIIEQGRAATKINVLGGQIEGVETTRGLISTSNVIIAAGPWSRSILRTIEINLPLKIVRHPVVSLKRPIDLKPSPAAMLDLTSAIYARPESGGLTLLGSLDPQIGHDQIDDPKDGPGYVSDSYINWTMERLIKRYPLYNHAQITGGWAGLMTLTPDWQPIIGRQLEVQGLYYVTGLSGAGFQISPAIGYFLSGAIAGEARANKILAPFSPGRFHTGRRHLSSYRSTLSE